MGAKNCPETPRQKMIGMMYLFLTAMLALNVSSEVLNGFGKVDESLRSSVESYQKRNAQIYQALEARNKINPVKVKHWLQVSDTVRKETEALFEEIRNYKWDIVIDADGLDPATPRIGEAYDIKAKDNIDAPTRIMIPAAVRAEKRKGVILRNRLIQHRDKLLALLDDAIVNHQGRTDSALIHSITTYLTPKDVKTEEGEHLEWEETYFAHMPVSASVVLLSKLQNDIKDVESLMINYFETQVDANDFRVNKLQAYIIPESNYIIKGGTFKANIILAGEDTTKNTNIIVNNTPLSNSKRGYYEKVCNEVGTFPVIGKLVYFNENGDAIPLDFKTEYKVEEPNATVSATKMNVLYVGADNPMSISVPGVASQDLDVTITNGTINSLGNGEYMARPKSITEMAYVVVKANINGNKIEIDRRPFRVKQVQDPLPFLQLSEFKRVDGKLQAVDDYVNTDMSATRLKSIKGIKAQLEDSDFEMNFEVNSYSIALTKKNGDSYNQDFIGDGMSTEATNFLKNNFDGTIIVKNIKVTGEDGIPRTLKSNLLISIN